MIDLFPKKSTTQRALIGIFISVILIIVGYFLLNIVARMEDPPLGEVTHIVLGSTLYALGGLGIFIVIRFLYLTAKKKKKREQKRKKQKIVFLKKEDLNKKNNTK